MTALPPPCTLEDGSVAEFRHDRFVPGTVQLLVNGTPQSHLDPEHPDELFFEYVRRIGHVIDAFRPAHQPITALHLGGGAFTLPRYVEATRRGSRQQVIEISGALVDYVREAFPLPSRASIRVRRGDARERLARLPVGLRGTVDLIVVDVFSGAITPAHLTSVEFYAMLQTFLRPDGLIAINAATGIGNTFVRGQLATLRECFGWAAAMAEPQVLKGRRFGNAVLIATPAADIDATREISEWLPRALARGPHPARLVEGSELAGFIAGAAPVTDANAADSPTPPSALFD